MTVAHTGDKAPKGKKGLAGAKYGPPLLSQFFTKKDAVAEWLRKEILSGVFESGMQLRQDAIARRLEVSPTPVREAFRELEAEGLLVSQPHHGVVVAHDEWEDITALYELRSILETSAMRRIVRHTNADLLAGLRRVVEQSERTLKTADLQSARVANGEFHVLLMGATGSRVYGDTAKSLISRARYYMPLNRQRMREVSRQHRLILDALASRLPQRAIGLMERHMKANLRWLYAGRAKAPTGKRRRSAAIAGGGNRP